MSFHEREATAMTINTACGICLVKLICRFIVFAACRHAFCFACLQASLAPRTVTPVCDVNNNLPCPMCSPPPAKKGRKTGRGKRSKPTVGTPPVATGFVSTLDDKNDDPERTTTQAWNDVWALEEAETVLSNEPHNCSNAAFCLSPTPSNAFSSAMNFSILTANTRSCWKQNRRRYEKLMRRCTLEIRIFVMYGI